ncbi:MAG: 50S ribosomal protein L29 [Bacteroidota bacterium]
MNQEVIKELATQEIKDRLIEERAQLVKLKLHHAVSPLENPNKIKAFRRTIARLLTELKRRELVELEKISNL